MIQIKKNEAAGGWRRMYFHLVDATDGMTPETGEAGGQPQISVRGSAWQNTANTLVAIGNGRYYVELTQSEVNITDRSVIEGRYKSANTAEALGTTIQIVEYPVDAPVSSRATLAGILGYKTSSVIQEQVTVKEGELHIVRRAANKVFDFTFSDDFPLVGTEKIYLTAKKDPALADSTAVFDELCTIIDADARMVNVALAAADLEIDPVEYQAEVTIYDQDGSSNPRKPIAFRIKIDQNVRHGV